ncbi:response regulator [Sulfurovum sp. ST-21]|uniref:Response regulator n=1 Tax=Sulfurovum indicum TaxID=2779528 RepID=A0A7M1S1K8_9BACT|nr:response regulator [Sulfurovum indicum]QOR61268.1 response regulator [Sulfurovum indicum]
MLTENLDILHDFNILYIEDDPSLLKQTKDVLDDFMQHTFIATNSKEALEVLNTHKVDLILSDILLEDENGIDFLKSLKESHYGKIPTILITAHTDTPYLLEAIKLKVESYIVKPINLKELLTSIHNIVLPISQQKEAKKASNLIKLISEVSEGKQIDVIKYIIQNLDNENKIHTSYTEIMSQIDISKPTLVKLFKKLSDKNILTNISHKVYQFNQEVLDSL